jgi:hypothetical protein
MELNAEQIKKALVCCHSCNEGDCKDCGYRQKAEGVEDLYITCTNVLIADALALITSQEQRIKELTEQAYRLECDLQLNADEKAVAKAIEQTKKATVRKMQERLTKDFDRLHKNNFITPEVRQWIIDQIAKEMVER